jgi:hypothetical protein
MREVMHVVQKSNGDKARAVVKTSLEVNRNMVYTNNEHQATKLLI